MPGHPAWRHIADRSFGRDPVLVSRVGAAVIEGIQKTGAISCAKHFPGYGDVNEDSHEMLPRTSTSMDDLWETHLKPFRAAAAADARMMMVGHLINSAVDPCATPSMSRKWIGDALRGRIGYKGLVITDDLDMGAVARKVDLRGAALKSAEAGADLLLVCHNRDNIDRVVEALVEYRRNHGSGEHDRVAAVRRKLAEDADYPGIEAIGCSAHKALAEEIEKKSI